MAWWVGRFTGSARADGASGFDESLSRPRGLASELPHRHAPFDAKARKAAVDVSIAVTVTGLAFVVAGVVVLGLAAGGQEQQKCKTRGIERRMAARVPRRGVSITGADGYTAPVPAGKKLRIVAITLGVLVVGLSAAAWSMWPTVDPIPEVLDAIDPELALADLTLEAQGPEPAIRLGDLQGKTVYLLIEGKESMMGGEGKQLRRALHRWRLPEDVIGFSIGDAPAGAAVMKGKIERDFVGPMRDELRQPIYVDYGGKFTKSLSLPQGHLGFVILDRSGEVVFRVAGDPSADQLAEIARLLGAEEPPPGPPAPEFEVGELSNASCSGKSCVLVFLDTKVARREIPGLEEGGFEGEIKESFEQIKKPSIRLARILAADWAAEDRSKIAGVIVGEAEGWSVDEWAFVAEAPAAREAFGIGDAAAMVIIDEQGRLAFVERGLIPFWKLSRGADILGIEPQEQRKRTRG